MIARRRGTAADAAFVLGARVLHAALMFATSAVVSRQLGAEGRGVYFAPFLAVSTLVAVSHLGLDQANVFLWGTERVAPRRLIGQAGAVAVGTGSLGALALVALSVVWPQLFSGSSPLVIAVAAAMVPLGVHIVYVTGLLTLSGRPVIPIVVNCVTAAAQLAALLVVASTGAASPSGFFLTTAATTIVGGLALGLLLASPRDWLAWDRALVQKSLAHSLVLHLGSTLLFLHLRADMFLVKGFIGTAALGQYSLAVVLAESMMLLADSLASVLLPRQMEGTTRDAATTALAGVRAVAIVGVAASLLWAAFGLPMLRLVFGVDFVPTYGPLLILLPGISMLGMQRMCGAALLREGKPWRIAGLQALGFTINLILNVVLIPVAGITGAAMASTVSYATMAAAFLRWTSRVAGAAPSAGVPRADDVRGLIRSLLRLVRRGDGVGAVGIRP